MCGSLQPQFWVNWRKDKLLLSSESWQRLLQPHPGASLQLRTDLLKSRLGGWLGLRCHWFTLIISAWQLEISWLTCSCGFLFFFFLSPPGRSWLVSVLRSKMFANDSLSGQGTVLCSPLLLLVLTYQHPSQGGGCPGAYVPWAVQAGGVLWNQATGALSVQQEPPKQETWEGRMEGGVCGVKMEKEKLTGHFLFPLSYCPWCFVLLSLKRLLLLLFSWKWWDIA